MSLQALAVSLATVESFNDYNLEKKILDDYSLLILL